MYFELYVASVRRKITEKSIKIFKYSVTKQKQKKVFLGKYLISMGVRGNGKNLTRKFAAKKTQSFYIPEECWKCGK